MDPRRTDSYWDYPLNGETSTNQYRSYLRRDLALLLTYASDQTHCLSQNWDFGNREPIGLGDMSVDGAIPEPLKATRNIQSTHTPMGSIST